MFTIFLMMFKKWCATVLNYFRYFDDFLISDIMMDGVNAIVYAVLSNQDLSHFENKVNKNPRTGPGDIGPH